MKAQHASDLAAAAEANDEVEGSEIDPETGGVV